jgi:hypothetical protein
MPPGTSDGSVRPLTCAAQRSLDGWLDAEIDAAAIEVATRLWALGLSHRKPRRSRRWTRPARSRCQRPIVEQTPSRPPSLNPVFREISVVFFVRALETPDAFFELGRHRQLPKRLRHWGDHSIPDALRSDGAQHQEELPAALLDLCRHR